MAVLTYRDLVESAFREAGVDAEGMIHTMPKGVLLIGSLLSSMIREVREVAYQTQIDWVADWSKYRNVFGGQPTPIEQVLHETLAWYRQQPDAEKTP
jgi:nucleoside-diphosphate-sugar epimerase